MAKIKFDPADFSLNGQNQKIIKSSLKSFKKSPLSEFSFEKAKSAQEIFKNINQSSSSIYLFVFGGMAGSSFLFDSFFEQDHKKRIYKINKVSAPFLSHLLKKNKTELKKLHFIFISKSGRTPEIVFYKKLLKSIYFENQISLKNKVTVLVSDLKSPLAQFARKEQALIISLKTELPGRFSVFTLGGFLQLYLQGVNPLTYSYNFSKTSDQIQNFLFQQRKKKEYWLCSSSQSLENFGLWLELVWSESLFKDYKKSSLIPSLKYLSLYKLRHAYIEELIAKREEIAILFLDLKKASLKKALLDKADTSVLKHSASVKDFLSFQDKNRKKIQALIQSKNIPFLNLEMDLGERSLFDLVLAFYQTLFLFGDFFKVNIFKNKQVDQLKRKVC